MIEVEKHQKIKRNALLYAEHGFKIVPVHGVIPDPDAKGTNLCTCGDRNCDKPGKHPRIQDWPNEGSTDPQKIEKWFIDWPNMNFGAIPPEGIVILDIDERNNGFSTLETLETKHGKLPETVTVETGNGRHLYFQYNSDIYAVCKTRLEGIDIKTGSGYVMGAGSRHQSGKLYQFASKELSLDNKEIAEAPQWLLEKIMEFQFPNLDPSDDDWLLPANTTIRKGFRNDTLTKKAGELWNKGYTKEELEDALLAINDVACDPPLNAKDVIQIARSISNYPRHIAYTQTDLGNSQRFIDEIGHKVRYCQEQKCWYIWNGKKWNEDKKNEIQELAKETVKEMYKKAKAISDPEIRKASLKHAQKSQGRRSIQNMISMSSSDRSINVNAEDLDTDNWLLNIENGTIDLKTGKLLPHDPNHLISKITNIEFDENAECPKWMDFLDYIFSGDMELIGYMQKLTGYCLTGSIKQQILPILYGNGNNGKTTFMQVLEGLLGEYCIYADVSSFAVSNSSNIRNDLARMKGSRLILTSEFEHNQHISEATVKSVTGGEKIPCRYLYGEYFEYRPTGKIMMATNYKPLIKGTDKGIWRRIHFIPFLVQIAERDRKENYHEELLEELPGILNWALEGCLQWQKEGLKKPPAVEDATTEYRKDMDDLADFLDTCCESASNAKIHSSDIFKAYTDWAMENSIKNPLSQRAFSKELELRGYKKKRDGKGIFWENIRLKDDSHSNSDLYSSIDDFFG
jgi:putative DNA primase/helicase